MSLASNQSQQMAKRLKQDLEKLAPALKMSASADANGNPMIAINDGSADIALARIARRSFEGFNIIHELSSSAGEGYPEHILSLAVNDAISLENYSRVFKACAALGCSQLDLIKVAAAAPQESDLASAPALELPNDARIGSVGA